jgi:hypothetical protein
MAETTAERISGRLWLVLPACLLCLVDQIVTLLGQPSGYWAGEHSLAQEGAPHGYWLLSRHPGWYIAAACCYLLLIVLIIVSLPRFLARVASAAFVIGHTWGTCWWMFAFFPGFAYWISFGMFLFSGFVLVLAFEMSDR